MLIPTVKIIYSDVGSSVQSLMMPLRKYQEKDAIVVDAISVMQSLRSLQSNLIESQNWFFVDKNFKIIRRNLRQNKP